MSVDTYANLKTEIANHLDRDDLASDIDTFIDLAEARHKREVRIRQMLTRSALTVSARQVSLPTGFLELKTLRLLTDPVTVLDEVNIDEMNRLRSETTGKPTRFVVTSEFEFDKSPDQSYSGEIIYWKAQTALSDSNTTNDILDNVPDLYLYGSLLAAEAFLGDDPRLNTWGELYKMARDDANAVARRRAGPLVSRVVGATP